MGLGFYWLKEFPQFLQVLITPYMWVKKQTNNEKNTHNNKKIEDQLKSVNHVFWSDNNTGTYVWRKTTRAHLQKHTSPQWSKEAVASFFETVLFSCNCGLNQGGGVEGNGKRFKYKSILTQSLKASAKWL